MKPHITFDRWIEANKDRIEPEDKDFRFLVHFVRLQLVNVYAARKGVSHVIAASLFETWDKLNAELKARGIKGPKLVLPKVKIQRPAVPFKRRKK
jgi:hypothetical protein